MGRFSRAWQNILSHVHHDREPNFPIPLEELNNRLRRISLARPFGLAPLDTESVVNIRDRLVDSIAEAAPPRIISLYGAGAYDLNSRPHFAADDLIREYINPYLLLDRVLSPTRSGVYPDSPIWGLLDARRELGNRDLLDNYPELLEPGKILDSIILDRADPREIVQKIRAEAGLNPAADSFAHDYLSVKKEWDTLASYPPPPSLNAIRRRMEKRNKIKSGPIMIGDASNYPYLGTEIEL